MRIYLQYAPNADDAARMRAQLVRYERLAEAQPQAKANAEEDKTGEHNPQEP